MKRLILATLFVCSVTSMYAVTPFKFTAGKCYKVIERNTIDSDGKFKDYLNFRDLDVYFTYFTNKQGEPNYLIFESDGNKKISYVYSQDLCLSKDNNVTTLDGVAFYFFDFRLLGPCDGFVSGHVAAYVKDGEVRLHTVVKPLDPSKKGEHICWVITPTEYSDILTFPLDYSKIAQ